MTEKELVLYIRRVIFNLQMVYDQLCIAFPDAEKFRSIKKVLKPEIQEQVEQWTKEHSFASFFEGNVPKEFNKPENFMEKIEYGRIKDLEPLNDIIMELRGDIEIFISSE